VASKANVPPGSSCDTSAACSPYQMGAEQIEMVCRDSIIFTTTTFTDQKKCRIKEGELCAYRNEYFYQFCDFGTVCRAVSQNAFCRRVTCGTDNACRGSGERCVDAQSGSVCQGSDAFTNCICFCPP